MEKENRIGTNNLFESDDDSVCSMGVEDSNVPNSDLNNQLALAGLSSDSEDSMDIENTVPIKMEMEEN